RKKIGDKRQIVAIVFGWPPVSRRGILPHVIRPIFRRDTSNTGDFIPSTHRQYMSFSPQAGRKFTMPAPQHPTCAEKPEWKIVNFLSLASVIQYDKY
ncbi:MAG TPA: hypothetical protein PLR32_04680, partial [candidate division Zixibacteria bacterium]|nr:hypothetical protein [candidate division Zixibacteria bacterium]